MSEELDSQERLEVLRTTDLERHWYSLDEKRVCGLCGSIISGREIGIGGSAGQHTLHCPTPGCLATSSHWRLFHLPSAEEQPSLFPNDFSFLADR